MVSAMDELIKALRICWKCPCDDDCPRYERAFDASEWNIAKCAIKLQKDAADAIERLTAEVDRKDKALQAWSKTWEQRKDNAIRHICEHCDTPIEVRLKEGACEDCPIKIVVKEIFDD